MTITENNNNYIPLPVKKWDKESLLKVLTENYTKTIMILMTSKKSIIQQNKILNHINKNYLAIFNAVYNDRITYKKII